MSIAEKAATISANNVAIAENEQKVFSAGIKSEYDRFWDAYQNNGESMEWGSGAFRGPWWNDVTFFPKYDIIPNSGNSNGYFNLNGVTNLRERIDGRGLKLNLKNKPSLGQFFRDSKTCELPDMDTSQCANFTEFIYNATKLQTIPRLNMTNATSATSTFYNTKALQNITFEGTIPISVSFAQSSLLTIESLRSIMTALYDYSGTTTTRTLTLHADAKARLTADDVKAITDKGWTLV